MAAKKFLLSFAPPLKRVVYHFKKNPTQLGISVVAGASVGVGVCLYNRKSSVSARELPIIGLDEEEVGLTLADFMAEPINDLEKLQKSPEMMHKMELLCMELQGKLCRELEAIEGTTKFRVDRWLKCEEDKATRNAIKNEGKCQAKVWEESAFPMLLYRKDQTDDMFEYIEGGGITCIMEDGAIFERAGVNISVVSGKLRPEAVKSMNSQGRELPVDEEMSFSAVGISSVIHPRNPNVPTKHFNFRYFEVQPEMSEKQWWFGGGADLTPYYINEQDFKHFHCTYRKACELHGPTYYRRFKKWCDVYFYIKHRCMSRGIGGIFFDDVKSDNIESSFNFVKSCSNAVIPSYIPIVKRRLNDPYGLREREWQLTRRGHYVEFNLLYDRGTKFGFNTPGARHESILMSLPARATWHYCFEPEAGSPEAKLVEVLKNPVEWTEV